MNRPGNSTSATSHRSAPLLPVLVATLCGAIAGTWLRQRRQAANPGAEAPRSDAMLTIDASHLIIDANAAAAALFGTSAAAMRGAPLERYIPRDLRTLDEQEPPAELGDAGLNLRMMGRRATDYAITGLKANGEQFPLEGSISMRQNDGAGGYSVIVRDISERKQVHAQLERSFSQLRQLSSALQTVREEERKYIARELHDDLGQLLATLRLDVALARQHGADNAQARRALQNMDDLIVTAISSLRRIAGNLRPRALDEGGLYFALHTMRQEFLQRYPLHFELFADEADLVLDDAFSTAVYRIVQESLTNIARHAQASHVTVTLYRLDSSLGITVQDNGRGIEDGDMEKTESLGLLGMRERVWGLLGSITIDGQLDTGGTRIEIVLPLPK